MKWTVAKQKLLEDKQTRQLYDAVDLRFEISKMIIDARIAKGLTQQELAEALNTKQPAIARLESGSYTPSFKILQQLATIFETQLLPPRFEFQELNPTYKFNVMSKYSARSLQPRAATTSTSVVRLFSKEKSYVVFQ